MSARASLSVRPPSVPSRGERGGAVHLRRRTRLQAAADRCAAGRGRPLRGGRGWRRAAGARRPDAAPPTSTCCTTWGRSTSVSLGRGCGLSRTPYDSEQLGLVLSANTRVHLHPARPHEPAGGRDRAAGCRVRPRPGRAGCLPAARGQTTASAGGTCPTRSASSACAPNAPSTASPTGASRRTPAPRAA